jgi:hypothetical protein
VIPAPRGAQTLLLYMTLCNCLKLISLSSLLQKFGLDQYLIPFFFNITSSLEFSLTLNCFLLSLIILIYLFMFLVMIIYLLMTTTCIYHFVYICDIYIFLNFSNNRSNGLCLGQPNTTCLLNSLCGLGLVVFLLN